MRLGMIGDGDAGKTTLARALRMRFGDSLVVTDEPGDRAEEWLTADSGLDGVVLAVSALDGPMPMTVTHLQLAARAHVAPVAIWIGRMDQFERGPEIVELVELEARELLAKNGFEDVKVPCVSGSALKAIEEMEGMKEGSRIAEIQALGDACLTFL